LFAAAATAFVAGLHQQQQQQQQLCIKHKQV